MTARELAAQLDIRADSLGQMELGHQAVPAELLPDWCHHLQITLTFSAHGIEESPDSLPPRHVDLFNALSPQQRQVVLDTLESVARLAGVDTAEPPEE